MKCKQIIAKSLMHSIGLLKFLAVISVFRLDKLVNTVKLRLRASCAENLLLVFCNSRDQEQFSSTNFVHFKLNRTWIFMVPCILTPTKVLVLCLRAVVCCAGHSKQGVKQKLTGDTKMVRSNSTLELF